MMQRKSLVEDSMHCPISHLLMKDPVLASDGYTYDRAAITQWFASKSTSPVPYRPPKLQTQDSQPLTLNLVPENLRKPATASRALACPFGHSRCNLV